MTTNDEHKSKKYEGYKSDEDIENLVQSSNFNHSDHDKKGKTSHSEEISYNNSLYKLKIEKEEKKREMNSHTPKKEMYLCKRIFNLITLFILLITFTLPFVYSIIENKLSNVYDSFKTKSLHFQINFDFFLIIWGLIILTLIFSIIRHSFMLTTNTFEIKEIKLIISNKLQHFFYFANLFLSAIAILWKNKFSQENGIILCISILASIFYFIPFYKIKFFNLFGLFNKIGFRVTLSFLLAFSNIMFIISIFNLIQGVLSAESIQLISFIIHCIIFSVAILVLVFFKDFYYVLMIIIFQLGIVVTNKNNYKEDNKFTLIFTILTAVSFLFSLLCAQQETEQDKEDLEIKYEEEKFRSNVL